MRVARADLGLAKIARIHDPITNQMESTMIATAKTINDVARY